MKCFCNRLYNISEPKTITEHVFSGSLCRTREFETSDGKRYCLIVFSLSDYKHLHFPHDEFKYLVDKLYALQSIQSISPSKSSSDVQKSDDILLSIKQQPFVDNFKIKFGIHSLTIGSITAFGLVKTTPFDDVHVFAVNKNNFKCDPKWDICICKNCPVFKQLIDFEATAKVKFSQKRPQDVILFD